MAVSPPAGSTRNWNVNVRKVAEELEREFDVSCSTYPYHGRTGQAWGIDVWVAPFRSKANAEQEKLGDQIQAYVQEHYRRLGIEYEIWWNWMREDIAGEWFDYSPWSRPASQGGWPYGDPDPETRRHEDHYHLQIKVGHIYLAPQGHDGLTDEEKAQIIDAFFENNYKHFGLYKPIGKLLISECRSMGPNGLWVSTAATLLEQENGGRNIFGADWGEIGVEEVPFARLPVTRERVQKLIAHIRGGGWSNGVGHGQPTWPAYIFEAEKLGGAHIPRNQMRVCFKVLNDLLNSYPYLDALEAYNDGRPGHNNPDNPYDLQFAAKHRAWKNRLN